MIYATRLLKCLVYGILICTSVAAVGAQEKDGTQSSSFAGAAAISSSDTPRFEVAPGIPLPAKGIVWILDTAENKPDLMRVYLNIAQVNGHRAGNVVRAQFFVLKMGATVELPGTAAKMRVNTHTPAIFVRKSEEEEEELQSGSNTKSVQEHYALLRLRVADDRRVICTFSAWEFGLKASRHEDVVEVATEEVAAGQWLKIIPKQALSGGEYAVVHMPDNRKLYEPHVYDFGIEAAASQPANH
jgi:hypothetical protein